ncbi:hypothetical protein C8R44DRAFT_894216 [Mycena epipterygia]|nr:hypothetical protein C8R44DRAFT_894216 [Mycena epipterygia]
MDALNPEHLQELIDGTGRDFRDLAPVVVRFTRLLGPTSWDLALNYLGHAIALSQYVEAVYPSFPEALITEGILPMMITVLCDFYAVSPPNAADSQSGILAHTFKMVHRLLIIASSFKLIIEALDAGCLLSLVLHSTNPKWTNETGQPVNFLCLLACDNMQVDESENSLSLLCTAATEISAKLSVLTGLVRRLVNFGELLMTDDPDSVNTRDRSFFKALITLDYHKNQNSILLDQLAFGPQWCDYLRRPTESGGTLLVGDAGGDRSRILLLRSENSDIHDELVRLDSAIPSGTTRSDIELKFPDVVSKIEALVDADDAMLTTESLPLAPCVDWNYYWNFTVRSAKERISVIRIVQELPVSPA